MALQPQRHPRLLPWALLALAGCRGTSGLSGPQPGSSEASAEPADFQAHLLLADSHRSIAGWAKAAPAERAAVEGMLDQVVYGQRIFVPSVVTGYIPNSDGSVQLQAQLRLLSPDGSVLFENQGSSAQQLDPELGDVVVLDPVYDVVFDPGDPTGTYRFEVTIRDAERSSSAAVPLQVAG